MHKPEFNFQSNFTALLPPGYGLSSTPLTMHFARAANSFGMFFFYFSGLGSKLKNDIDARNK